MNVSILVITFNEEHNLSRLFDSIAWCDDILVIDSGSSDGTVPICLSRGARVVQRDFDNFAGQRNFGLDCGGLIHDWVLHLDADEACTPEFITALRDLEPAQEVSAYQVPSKMMLLGRWLKHSSGWPTYQVRLGHRDRLRFKQIGHGQREDLPPEQVAVFHHPYLHFSFSGGLHRWLSKHVRYAADEAKLIAEQRSSERKENGGGAASKKRRALKRASALLPVFLRPVARFVYTFVVCRGFLDGRVGVLYAFMMAVYEAMTVILFYEARLSSRKTGSAQRLC